ncbi:MAG: GntR family transcriptional regulator [Bifidobacteriaceae bacterium]|nr:GntR family transcriptional regulator [Bifidobacteriaceae bacterium]
MKAVQRQGATAYEQIIRGIASGDFAPGQALSETQLAEYCGVSRTPVREAIQRLESERVIVNADRVWRVSDPTQDEIYEMYETNAILEAANARLAAGRRTDLDLAVLHGLADDARATPPDADVQQLIALSHEFALALWRAAHNRSLMEILERIGRQHGRFGGRSSLSQDGQWGKTQTYFEEILGAIEARDADAAAATAERQALAVRDVRIAMWRVAHTHAGTQ